MSIYLFLLCFKAASLQVVQRIERTASTMTLASNDPLLVLRQAINSKTTITYLHNDEPVPTLLHATHISLGSAILPKSGPTRYTKPGAADALLPNDFYTLEAIYLAWLLRDAPGADYMRQARECGLAVGFVSVTERKNVVEWLEGKVNDLDRIKPLAPGASITLSSPSINLDSCSQKSPQHHPAHRHNQSSLSQHRSPHQNAPLSMPQTLYHHLNDVISQMHRMPRWLNGLEPTRSSCETETRSCGAPNSMCVVFIIHHRRRRTVFCRTFRHCIRGILRNSRSSERPNLEQRPPQSHPLDQ